MKKKYIWTMAMLAMLSWGAGEISLAATTTAPEKSQVVIRKSSKPVLRAIKESESTTTKSQTAKTSVASKKTTSAAKTTAAAKKTTAQAAKVQTTKMTAVTKKTSATAVKTNATAQTAKAQTAKTSATVKKTASAAAKSQAAKTNTTAKKAAATTVKTQTAKTTAATKKAVAPAAKTRATTKKAAVPASKSQAVKASAVTKKAATAAAKNQTTMATAAAKKAAVQTTKSQTAKANAVTKKTAASVAKSQTATTSAAAKKATTAAAKAVTTTAKKTVTPAAKSTVAKTNVVTKKVVVPVAKTATTQSTKASVPVKKAAVSTAKTTDQNVKSQAANELMKKAAAQPAKSETAKTEATTAKTEVTKAGTAEKKAPTLVDKSEIVILNGATKKAKASEESKKAAVKKAVAQNKQKAEKTISVKTSQIPTIDVGLLSGGEVKITGLSDFRAESDGKVVATYKNGESLSIRKNGNKLEVNGKKLNYTDLSFTTGKAEPAFAAKGNQYRGLMKVMATVSGVTLINQVSMEDYLKGVVPCEIVPSWQMEALKAQAVAARSYALFHKNRYRASGYDVTDDTTTQVYRGASSETESTNKAVAATAGEVVTYSGKPIDAVFHASGGGYTEDCLNVWRSSVPYLKGVPEEKYAEPWTKNAEVAILAKLADVGNVKSIKLSKLRIGQAHHSDDRGISGRVKSVVVVGTKGTKTLTGDRLQAAFGLNSTLFDMTVKGKKLTFTGYGYGHGLGLSQWGAQAMAEKHKNEKDYYKKILGHYFTNTKIEKIY